MKCKTYKYTIHDRLCRLNLDDYQISWKFFPEALGISKYTWKSWIYIKANDPREIPQTALVKIAVFFQCSVDDLFEKSFLEKIHERIAKLHFLNNTEL